MFIYILSTIFISSFLIQYYSIRHVENTLGIPYMNLCDYAMLYIVASMSQMVFYVLICIFSVNVFGIHIHESKFIDFKCEIFKIFFFSILMNIPIYAREVIHKRRELDKLKWENVRVGNLIEIYNKELNKKRIVSVNGDECGLKIEVIDMDDMNFSVEEIDLSKWEIIEKF